MEREVISVEVNKGGNLEHVAYKESPSCKTAHRGVIGDMQFDLKTGRPSFGQQHFSIKKDRDDITALFDEHNFLWTKLCGTECFRSDVYEKSRVVLTSGTCVNEELLSFYVPSTVGYLESSVRQTLWAAADVAEEEVYSAIELEVGRDTREYYFSYITDVLHMYLIRQNDKEEPDHEGK